MKPHKQHIHFTSRQNVLDINKGLNYRKIALHIGLPLEFKIIIWGYIRNHQLESIFARHADVTRT